MVSLWAGGSKKAEHEVTWRWSNTDEKVSMYRWQLDGEDEDGWTYVGSGVNEVTLTVEEGSTLYVQATYDGYNWSRSGASTFIIENGEKVIRAVDTATQSESVTEGETLSGETTALSEEPESLSEDTAAPADGTAVRAEEAAASEEMPGAEEKTTEKKEDSRSRRALSIRINASPYSLALYRFYNGYNTTSTRVRTHSNYGCGAVVEVSIPLLSWLSISPELGYDFILKADTIIPNARGVQYIKSGAALDFTFGSQDSLSVYTGLFGGAMMHINNNKANVTPYFGAKLGCDYSVSEHFSIGASSRVTFALFTGRSQTLMDSMTILIDPVSITLAYKF